MWQNIDLYCYIYKVVARTLGSDYALASSSGFPLHVLNCCSGSFHGGASPRRPRGSYATAYESEHLSFSSYIDHAHLGGNKLLNVDPAARLCTFCPTCYNDEHKLQFHSLLSFCFIKICYNNVAALPQLCHSVFIKFCPTCYNNVAKLLQFVFFVFSSCLFLMQLDHLSYVLHDYFIVCNPTIPCKKKYLQ